MTSAAPHGVDNNFNLLRLLFALMVAVYHATFLPGVPGWASLEGPMTLAAEIGVQGFFVLSGYLVWSSLERSASLQLYAEKRVRRLYPGYAAVIVVCVLGALIFSPEARAELGAVARYLGWNLLFLNFMEPNLPGVFDMNRVTEVNGALWTLKIEVMFYLILPLLALAIWTSGRFRWALIVAIYVAAEAWRIGLEYLGDTGGKAFLVTLSRQLPGQMSFFITGIAFHMLKLSKQRLDIAGGLGAVLLLLSIFLSVAEPVRALGLGAVSIWAATGLPRLFDAARFGDLSYGLYIVHFPIIQTIIAMGVFGRSPALGLAIAAAAALAGAVALWWLVERPALRSDSAYRVKAS
jgi:peptidoglycan/LPS O-acetylase OafA/YrhL